MGEYLSIGLSFLVLVLFFVALIWGSRWVIKRGNLTMKSRHMKVIDRLMLGQDKSIVIAEISNRFYILGVSGHQISLIKELEDFEPGAIETEMPESFSFVLAETIKKQISKIGKKDKGEGKDE